MDESGHTIKKLLKRLQKQEKSIGDEKVKRQEFEYRYRQLKEQFDKLQDTIDALNKQSKSLVKKNTELVVELERYKVKFIATRLQGREPAHGGSNGPLVVHTIQPSLGMRPRALTNRETTSKFLISFRPPFSCI